ncbi:MAG: hypothetical protein ACR2G2_03995 [Pseudonocardia sp.]
MVLDVVVPAGWVEVLDGLAAHVRLAEAERSSAVRVTSGRAVDARGV